MRELGRHFVFELFRCDAQALDDLNGIQEAMERGAEDGGAEIVGRTFHKFSPQGVTGVVIITESHLSIHTWPELGYAAVDLFTCNMNADPTRMSQRLVSLLKPRFMTVMELKRGLIMGEGV
ncbi:MAG: adenosylmethionine decarboxylase [Candidatus Methanomethylicaceae archaeon]